MEKTSGVRRVWEALRLLLDSLKTQQCQRSRGGTQPFSRDGFTDSRLKAAVSLPMDRVVGGSPMLFSDLGHRKRKNETPYVLVALKFKFGVLTGTCCWASSIKSHICLRQATSLFFKLILHKSHNKRGHL